jgi:GNAT superfamily N-acetyltransferase
VRRGLGDGYELDDDRARVDLAAVHRYLCDESYWAKGRPLETQRELVDTAVRIVGLYHEGRQIGFCRAATTPGLNFVYLADVYVLDEHRGRGLGIELVREMIENGPYADRRWLLDTSDAHDLYRKLGFDAPGPKVMERRPPSTG